ncbi:MAG TPA: hypothetical protein V6D23_20350 [Candidatus Obscuribacterales bacterium]
MTGPFYALLVQAAGQLRQQPEQQLELQLENISAYRCQRRGACCRNPWKVDVSREYFDVWGPALQALSGESEPVMIPYRDIEAAQGAYAWLRKRQTGSGHQCVFQAADHSCRVHAELGEAALPPICRSFPRETAQAGPQYANPTLSSACQHAAAMLDQTSDLLFELKPLGHPGSEADPSQHRARIRLGQERLVDLPEFLPWLGWMLDQVMDYRLSATTALNQIQALLSFAAMQPELALPALLAIESGSRGEIRSEPGQALELFLALSPFSDPDLERFVRLQLHTLRLPLAPLSHRQRLQRFLRHYLLRRLLNLEALSQWPLTLPQYLFLLGFGVLTIQLLLLHYQQGAAGLPREGLIWAINHWEAYGIQHPYWIKQVGLGSWPDTYCLEQLQRACGLDLGL